MVFNTKSESAVSPVIGTILLVAIVVVLIAIILVVLMGLAGDTNEKKVGLNAQSESGANATLILYGGASLSELVKLEMIDQGSANGTYVPLWEKASDGSETVFVGLPYLAKEVARPEESMAVYDTRINVRGTFSDGSETILLVQPMTFYNVEVPEEEEVPEIVEKPFSKYFKEITLSNTGLDCEVDILGNLGTGKSLTIKPSGYDSNTIVGVYLEKYYLRVTVADDLPPEYVSWTFTLSSPARIDNVAARGGSGNTYIALLNTPNRLNYGQSLKYLHSSTVPLYSVSWKAAVIVETRDEQGNPVFNSMPLTLVSTWTP